MKPSDVVHKTVLKAGGAQKPSAKASHGTHQRKHALGPHNRSRSAPHETDRSLTIFEFGLREKAQLPFPEAQVSAKSVPIGADPIDPRNPANGIAL